MIEGILDELYRGKCNVCIAAKKADVSPEEMKRLFQYYVLERPLDVNDPVIWSEDLELSWPWI